MESPPKRSCSVVSPCNPLSVWSPGAQFALGTDAGNPSPESTCAEAMEALSNRQGTTAAETANNLTRPSLFIIPPCRYRTRPARKRVRNLTPGKPLSFFSKLRILSKSCEYFGGCRTQIPGTTRVLHLVK